MDTPGESRGHGLETNLERQNSDDTRDSLSGELEGRRFWPSSGTSEFQIRSCSRY